MKIHYFVFVILLLLVAPLAFSLGAVTASGANADIPHGLLEYWIERYQTAWSGIIALLGLFLVVRQIQSAQKQHKSQMLFNLEPERRALHDVRAYAKEIRGQIPSKAALENSGTQLPEQTLDLYADKRRALIENAISPAILWQVDKVKSAVTLHNEAINGPNKGIKLEPTTLRKRLLAILVEIDRQDELTLERKQEMDALFPI